MEHEQHHIGELLVHPGCWLAFFQVAGGLGLLYLFFDYFTFKAHPFTNVDLAALLLSLIALGTRYCLVMAIRAAAKQQEKRHKEREHEGR